MWKIFIHLLFLQFVFFSRSFIISLQIEIDKFFTIILYQFFNNYGVVFV